MKNQTKQQPQIKLDRYAKQKLGNAYYALYNALVAEGQAQNMSLGASWYNALFKISDILQSGQSNVALDYLKRFFMSHRTGEIKKMMTDTGRNNTIETNPDIRQAASNRVKQETENLDKAIQSVIGGEVLIVLKPHGGIPGQGFADWAWNQPNEITIDLDQDQRAFEREYRKYVMRQKHK